MAGKERFLCASPEETVPLPFQPRWETTQKLVADQQMKKEFC